MRYTTDPLFIHYDITTKCLMFYILGGGRNQSTSIMPSLYYFTLFIWNISKHGAINPSATALKPHSNITHKAFHSVERQ